MNCSKNHAIVDRILSFVPKDQPLPWITPEMIDLDMLTLNEAAVPFLLEYPEHIDPFFAWGNPSLTDYCLAKALEDPKSAWFPRGYDPLLMLNPHPIVQDIVERYVDGWGDTMARIRKYLHLYSSAMRLINFRTSQDVFCARADSLAYLQFHTDEISTRGFSRNPAIFDHSPELQEYLYNMIQKISKRITPSTIQSIKKRA